MYLIVNSEQDLNKLNKIKTNSNVLVWYYADWCGHCKMMKDDWEKLIKSKPNVNLAKVSDIYVKPDDNIPGFPTLKLFKSTKTASGKKSVIEYQGSRDIESFKQFIKKNVKSGKKSRKKKAGSRNRNRKQKKKTKTK
jgi:protein disulfide-isomerase A6